MPRGINADKEPRCVQQERTCGDESEDPTPQAWSRKLVRDDLGAEQTAVGSLELGTFHDRRHEDLRHHVGEHFACAEEEDRDIEVRDREPALEDALLLGERTAVVGAGSYRVDTSNLGARHDHG